MATTDRSGVRIWYESQGEGPPVVLLHGMMGRSEIWRMEGYVDGLSDEYRLILVDARGHGHSERLYDPADYRIHRHVADVLAVLDELAIPSAALCGWSMGACAALAVAAVAPERVDAVAALGCAPEWGGFPDVPAPCQQPEEDQGWAARFDNEGMGWIVADLEREGRPGWARMVSRADPAAMAACDRGLRWLEVEPRPLRDLAMPLLFAWGVREVEPAELRVVPPNARLVVIPGEGHVGAFRRSDVLVPVLRDFLAAARPVVPA